MAKSKREIQQFWAKRGVVIPMNHVFTVAQNKQRIEKQNQQLIEQAQKRAQEQTQELVQMMQQQQKELITAASEPGPKAAQSLKSRNYQPKFKTRGSRAETNRAVSRGTAQFTNPLSMGGGLGGSSINLG